MKRLALLILCSSVCIAGQCYADETDNCSSSCPDGQVLASFADGEHSSCVCVDQGSPMVDAPAAVDTGCQDPNDTGACN